MTSRQRVLAALDHQQPDAVPLDLGGTAVTGIHCSCVASLRDHYGLEKRPVKVHEPYQMLGYVEEDLKGALGVDVAGAMPAGTMFGYPPENWKPWRAPWGQDLLVPERFNTTTDADGNVYMYPDGDTSAPACAMMPRSGYFFDSIIRQPPIDEDKLNVEDNLEEFTPIGAADLRRLVQGVQEVAQTGRAVIVWTPGTNLGDIAQVPGPFLKHPKGIRDLAEWYMSTVTRREFVNEIFRRQVEIAIRNLDTINAAAGGLIDIVVLCGTDFGTQSSSFCSVSTFRELWLPHYRRMTDWIHRNTPWKIMKHSCGAVSDFIESFIEAGFDILNPVQCSARGMDPQELKRRFGDRITFWGGGIDTQKLLPFGSPQQVRQQVLERLAIFSRGGGYVCNTIHNAQAKTPVANLVAMIDAVHEFNGALRR